MPGAVRRIWSRTARDLCSLMVIIVLLASCGRASTAHPPPTAAPATEPVSLRWAATPTPDERPRPTLARPPRATPSPSRSPSPTPGPDPAALAARIDPLVAAVPATVGIVVALPDGTPLYQHQADRLFEAASLYKLGIMVEVYRQREAGSLSFDEAVTLYPGFFTEGDDVYRRAVDAGARVPIGQLLWAMITQSSNVAAHALLDRVGTAQVNATVASLGLTQTEIRWSPSRVGWEMPAASTPTPAEAQAVPLPEPSPPTDAPEVTPADEPVATGEPTAAQGARGAWSPRRLAARPAASPPRTPLLREAATVYNVTSPVDMARLFAQLLAGQVVSHTASQEMLDLLAQQNITDRLPVGLPPGTRVAHKTGNLPGIVHDAGVVYAPGGPIIVAVLSEDARSERAVNELIRQVAAVAYESRR
ncbi:MAG: serine hydrolase [Sphaerobacter sp.]|nr:serine hydrolase [Sphaerobacter sp.]